MADHEACKRARITLQAGDQCAGGFGADACGQLSGKHVLQRSSQPIDDKVLGTRRTKIGEKPGTARQSEPGERTGHRKHIEGSVFNQAPREHRKRPREADPEHRARDLPAQCGAQAHRTEVAGKTERVITVS
jgi:hypothetical protein